MNDEITLTQLVEAIVVPLSAEPAEFEGEGDDEKMVKFLRHIRERRTKEVHTVFRTTLSESAHERFADGWTEEELREWRVEKFRWAMDLFCVDPVLAEPLRDAAAVVEEVAEKSRTAYPQQ